MQCELCSLQITSILGAGKNNQKSCGKVADPIHIFGNADAGTP